MGFYNARSLWGKQPSINFDNDFDNRSRFCWYVTWQKISIITSIQHLKYAIFSHPQHLLSRCPESRSLHRSSPSSDICLQFQSWGSGPSRTLTYQLTQRPRVNLAVHLPNMINDTADSYNFISAFCTGKHPVLLIEKMGERRNVKYSTHIYKTGNTHTHRIPPPSLLPLLSPPEAGSPSPCRSVNKGGSLPESLTHTHKHKMSM